MFILEMKTFNPTLYCANIVSWQNNSSELIIASNLLKVLKEDIYWSELESLTSDGNAI